MKASTMSAAKPNSIDTNAGNMNDSQKKVKYRRNPDKRIFVNRSLNLNKIKFFGFDMDYTLAVYKSPDYETLCFEELKERLINIGYPKAIKDFKYDPSFPVRGLWFDKIYGNLLKVDSYGNILICVHGLKIMKQNEIARLYPNKFLQLNDNRCYVLNTLFNLPETYMLACIVDYFSHRKDYEKTDTGVKAEYLYIPYTSIFQDVRASIDWVYLQSNVKDETVKDIEKYIERNDRLPVLLERIQEYGAQNLLITNSNFSYTDKIMKYLLEPVNETKKPVKKWTEYFDYVVVDAKKPGFFKDGTLLRQVDQVTESLSIGCHVGPMKKGQIYSGGSCSGLSQMIGATGKDVLYIGDHIYGDILKSKKERGWRTFLVIPELRHELKVWTEKKHLFEEISYLEVELSRIYRDLDSSSQENPNSQHIRNSLKEVKCKMDLAYGFLGSLFRSDSQQTFFAAQVMRYADLYAASVTNLLYYPFCYSFVAPRMLMSHESTVDHDDSPPVEDNFASRARTLNQNQDMKSPVSKKSRLSTNIPNSKNVPNLRADTPKKLTYSPDDDDDDDDDDDSDDN
ncbi:cytosolic purine 5'-nucleotidase isoform X2 [Octopus sinensis]|uniref:Cytosolic purine 5'-nucleotidase isoform X2 n=1 Tax=Octopus sinensis TaxID=2607531 RepID=A0A7E6FKR3_9MOLL|nr:cytosolic purine 5'-nucleotidase isoform X2 [Octopus sinensis]